MTQPATTHPTVPAATKTTVKTVYVPTPDPEQAAKIAALRASLADAQKRPEGRLIQAAPQPRPKAIVQPPPSSVPPPPAGISKEDQQALESIRCENQRKQNKDELDLLISDGHLAQYLVEQKRADAAANFSQWVAQVRDFLRGYKNGFVPDPISQFENAHGNQWIKVPASMDDNSASLWREIEAKKESLAGMKQQEDYYRCYG